MEYTEFIDYILRESCADERIHNGIIDVTNIQHLHVIREHILRRTDDEFATKVFKALTSDLNLTEGNFPERQAYNTDGTLVTFPDPESKKAAIERGSHFEQPKTRPTTDTSPTTSDDEPSTPVNVFATTETPEQRSEKRKQQNTMIPSGTNISLDDIQLSDRYSETDTASDPHQLYDILKSLQSININNTDVSADESFTLDKLHPSVLFALSEKWTFDKSGDWYDEFNKFKGNTDRRGQVQAARSDDKDKMDMWISDYERRKSGIDTN